jgi:hypothetical protein
MCRLRGLDLETTETLHRLLVERLREVSHCLGAISSEVSAEHGDAIAHAATDLERLVALGEVLQFRNAYPSQTEKRKTGNERHREET